MSGTHARREGEAGASMRGLAEARAFLAATEALGRALYDADIETLDSALERRQHCFDAVSPLAGEALAPDVRTLLLRTSLLDRKILAAAVVVRDEALAELEQLMKTRQAARAFMTQQAKESAMPEPHFVARHV